MVHDLLDFPTIRKKRIDPDLARFERCSIALRPLSARLRLDAGGDEMINLGQFARGVFPGEQLFKKNLGAVPRL